VSGAVAEWKRMLDEQTVINSVGITAVIFALKPSQKAAVYAASYPYLPDVSAMFGKGLLPRTGPPAPLFQGPVQSSPVSPLTSLVGPDWLH